MKKILQLFFLLMSVLMLPAVTNAQDIYGDVNSDLEVNIADVNAIIDIIFDGYSTSAADVNGDLEVNIADVNAIIDIILRGNVQPKHDYVDLGLPSGTLWATCNVGASSPEEYGWHYAWGETETKSEYSSDTYLWCQNLRYIYPGGLTDISGSKYDVAHVKWGGKWRMPTYSETQELLNECDWQSTTSNGVIGRLVTGPNGNSIFLPAAGYRFLNKFYEGGYYWSSTEAKGGFYFNEAFYDFYTYRISGLSVRPVQSKTNSEFTPTPGTVIDLGLSVKWASHNVGASSPEEYGDHYAWAETQEKSYYYWDTYMCFESDCGTYSDPVFAANVNDIKNTRFDVAHVKWEGKWRMPTTTEFQELIDRCSWSWTKLNGKDGYFVTGPNGNSIFLPAGGVFDHGVLALGFGGKYWSSSLRISWKSMAFSLTFSQSNYRLDNNQSRYIGQCIRPVQE